MTKPNTTQEKTTRAAHLQWVPISEMKVSPKAQREFKENHAESLASDFDLEAMGYPVVNKRDGNYYVVDGQHRIAALKIIGYGDQAVQCEVFEDLTEAEEAELFLRRDRRRAVQAFDRFKIGVVADREIETDIDRIVRANGLRVANDQAPTSIGAVSALERTYRAGGAKTLARTLRILRDSFPDDYLAFRREMIEGAGLVCQRYNGQLDDAALVERLKALKGGANNVLTRTARIRSAVKEPMAQCTAAALVEIANSGRGGKKLPSWWAE